MLVNRRQRPPPPPFFFQTTPPLQFEPPRSITTTKTPWPDLLCQSTMATRHGTLLKIARVSAGNPSTFNFRPLNFVTLWCLSVIWRCLSASTIPPPHMHRLAFLIFVKYTLFARKKNWSENISRELSLGNYLSCSHYHKTRTPPRHHCEGGIVYSSIANSCMKSTSLFSSLPISATPILPPPPLLSQNKPLQEKPKILTMHACSSAFLNTNYSP